MKYLLMDFGASRVKSAIFDTAAAELYGFEGCSPVPPVLRAEGKFEVSPDALRKLFSDIVNGYAAKSSVDGICFCTEMHGFVLKDEDGKCLSNYISWQDERDAFATNKMFPAFAEAFPPEDYLARTGMFIASSPVMSLLHVLKKFSGRTVKVACLPELLAEADGKLVDSAHISSTAGLGLWNPEINRPDPDIIEYVRSTTGCNIAFNRVVTDLVPAGSFKGIPIFCGMGDLQCAVIGAGNDENSISVNMGTGSQVSWISGRDFGVERRPLVGGKMMQTVTHIPSGRALNNFIGFLRELAPDRDFWREMATLNISEVAHAGMVFDLNIFHGAWRYRNGGSITGIMEHGLTVQSFLAALVKSYCNQYLSVIKSFSPPADIRIILSGGIPGRIPVVSEYLASETGMQVLLNHRKEETLCGLQKLAGQLLKKPSKN